jgi:ribulose-phosphate 3-epimerase
MTQVVPAIIPKIKEQFEEEVKKVSSFAKLVQIDISDGLFTPFKTLPYNERDTDYYDKLKKEEEGLPKWEEVEYEVHLMVKNPEEVVIDWIHAGVSTVIAHIEATENFQKIIDICKENEVSVGIALKPSTDIERIKQFVGEVQLIQVMGSDMLGKHGTELDEKAVEMIKALQALYPNKTIAIDIGVSNHTEEVLIKSGADKLISGSYILDSEDPIEAYNELAGE